MRRFMKLVLFFWVLMFGVAGVMSQIYAEQNLRLKPKFDGGSQCHESFSEKLYEHSFVLAANLPGELDTGIRIAKFTNQKDGCTIIFHFNSKTPIMMLWYEGDPDNDKNAVGFVKFWASDSLEDATIFFEKEIDYSMTATPVAVMSRSGDQGDNKLIFKIEKMRFPLKLKSGKIYYRDVFLK